MRIDNDFLTLMGLLCRRSNLTGKMVKATEPKTIRAFHKMLDEQGAKIDALVAKINAADDAAARDMEILLFKSIDPANDPDYKELTGFSSDSPIAWVLKEWVEGKPYRIDNPFNPFNNRACEAKDAAPAKPSVINYPFRKRPKDTAPASPFNSFEEILNFFLPLADADCFEDHLAQPAKTVGDKLFEELRISQELLRATQAENAKLKAQLKDQEGR
jgi:hypothetical protein